MKDSHFSKKTSVLLGFTLAACAICVVPASAADLKVGFVSVAKVMSKAPQLQEAENELEREFAPKDRGLNEHRKEIAKLEDKLVRDGAVMAEKKRRDLTLEIRALKRELRRLEEEFREDYTLRRNELQNKLNSKVVKVIRSLAKAEKYDLIIVDAAIYASDRINITDKVIKRMTADFKASEGGAKAKK